MEKNKITMIYNFEQYNESIRQNESYEINDFKGLDKEAKKFDDFKILDVKRDPAYGYDNVYLMLIQFKDGEPGLCIYDTEKEQFIEEPGGLSEWEYNVTPEELYKKYRFVVPGYDEDELED